MFGFLKRKGKERCLFYKTDIHSHVVPGIDDGSPFVERSVELVSAMKEWGLERIIATPHVTQDKYENTPETVNEAFLELKGALSDASVDINIEFAAEYRIDEFFIEQVRKGSLMNLPNGYLLIENSFVQEPLNLDSTLFNLRMAGHKLILAHPERYAYYHAKRERYDKLHANGILFQINLLSLAGSYGKDVRKIAEYLIDKGYVDFIGTDLHRRTHVREINSYLGSKAYRRHCEQLQGQIQNDTAFILRS